MTDDVAALHTLAFEHRSKEQFEAGRAAAERALTLLGDGAPDDEGYWWRCADEFAVSSYFTGHFEASARMCREMLASGRVPLEHRARIEENRIYAEAKLGPLLPGDTSRAGLGGGALSRLLSPARPTAIVDIGANPVEGDPPYGAMLREGLCTVTGFEPLPSALAELNRRKTDRETYLPWAVGDGGTHPWHECAIGGMSSVFPPDRRILDSFTLFQHFGAVAERSEIATRRLDDIAEVGHVDFLKIDVQGSELAVFQSGRQTLRSAVAIQTEVSFVTLYEGQPAFGEIDVELRSQGFIPHSFAAIKRWPLAPYVVQGAPRAGLNQLLEGDLVYVRNFFAPESMSDEQFKQLALIAHHIYGSFDLALRCVIELAARGAVPDTAMADYRALLTA